MRTDTNTPPIFADSADRILPGGPVSLDPGMGSINLSELASSDDTLESLEMCALQAELIRIRMESLARVILAKATAGADCTAEACELARMMV